MGRLYLIGVGIAFLVGLVKVSISLSALLSVRAKNLKKIGLYYSCINATYTSARSSIIKLIAYLAWMLFIAPIFSWFSVASSAWLIIHWLGNRTETPDDIKKIQFKIANVDLQKEQLIELQEEVAKKLGIISAIRTGDESEDEDPYLLVLETGDWYAEVRVDPLLKTLLFYSHPPDYGSEFYSTFEYKFEDEQMMNRLIEDHTDNYGKKIWIVRDGVVLENEIRNRKTDLEFDRKPVEEDLADYSSKVQWHAMSNYIIRFFVMQKHPNLFTRTDVRRIIRSELERLKSATQRVILEAKNLGLNIEETRDGYKFMRPENFSEENKIKSEKLFSEDSLGSLGFKSSELHVTKRIQDSLLKQLGIAS